MTVFGISARSLVSLARIARTDVGAPRPLLVIGVMAGTLARELAAGGDPAMVSLRMDAAAASVVVLVVGGAPTEDETDVLRRATRAGVPVVAVQIDPRDAPDLPYVRATHVVTCQPGRALPGAEIASAIAACVRPEDAGLGERLPLLRSPLVWRMLGRSAVRAAAIGGLPWFAGQHLPLLAAAQVRMSQGIASARGQNSALPVSPELGITLAVGLTMRSVARRLAPTGPVPLRLVHAGLAAAGTLLVGAIAARRPG